jgi:hypothetical protein
MELEEELELELEEEEELEEIGSAKLTFFILVNERTRIFIA